MTLASYATKEDLIGGVTVDAFLSADAVAVVSTWTDDEVDRIIARASEAVDRITARASFDTDDTGAPTDDNVAAGLRMATCALVEQWMEVGEENDVDGLAGTQLSVTGYSGMRAPIAGPRVLRPLTRCGLLAQPGVTVPGDGTGVAL